jgi:hypothetical protein
LRQCAQDKEKYRPFCLKIGQHIEAQQQKIVNNTPGRSDLNRFIKDIESGNILLFQNEEDPSQ